MIFRIYSIHRKIFFRAPNQSLSLSLQRRRRRRRRRNLFLSEEISHSRVSGASSPPMPSPTPSIRDAPRDIWIPGVTMRALCVQLVRDFKWTSREMWPIRGRCFPRMRRLPARAKGGSPTSDISFSAILAPRFLHDSSRNDSSTKLGATRSHEGRAKF